MCQLHFDLCTGLVMFRGLLLLYSLLFFHFTTLLFLQPFAPMSVDHLDLIFALNWLWLRFYANQKATEDSLSSIFVSIIFSLPSSLSLRGLPVFSVGAGHITYDIPSVITLMLDICLVGYSYSQNHEPCCF